VFIVGLFAGLASDFTKEYEIENDKVLDEKLYKLERYKRIRRTIGVALSSGITSIIVFLISVEFTTKMEMRVGLSVLAGFCGFDKFFDILERVIKARSDSSHFIQKQENHYHSNIETLKDDPSKM